MFASVDEIVADSLGNEWFFHISMIKISTVNT